MLEVSIAFFLAEFLHASCGGAWAAAQAWEAAQAEAALAEFDVAQAPEPSDARLAAAKDAVKVRRGAAWIQEPSALDPRDQAELFAPPSSVLSTGGDEVPEWIVKLAAEGVRVEAREVHEVGSAAAAAGGGSGPFPPVRYRLREYTIYPPSLYVEPFTLQVPSPLPATPKPLLVVFHKFGSSHLDVLQNTDFVRQCAQRGWFMVCPLGASKKHFGSLESQSNTEAVLDWMLANASLRIDRQRIYGIGFSMGGGAALNYAARHRDGAHAMFAALIDHSGGVALNNTYYNDPPVRFIFDFWFGDGSAGSAVPWKMTRSSVLDFDPISQAIDTTTDLARNLDSTPLQIWRASNDAIPYVPTQCDALDLHLTANLGRQTGNTYSYTVVPYTGHAWSMVDASAACDWLGQFTLQTPLSGRTLADVDAVYEHFFVEQDAAGAFTPFDWSLGVAANRLDLSATANLKRLSFDPVASGLTITSDLTVAISGADATGDEVTLVRWMQSPSAVLRDGVATANWIYDAQTLELTLFETDGAAHVWIVSP